MIKALPIMELFQIIKRCSKQPALNLQKCYERTECDQNMRVKSRGQRAEDRIIGWEAGGQINIKEEINRLKDKGMSNIYLKGLRNYKRKLFLSLPHKLAKTQSTF